ncbi:hypothetical protein IFR05_002644 [Cadophora sp. M221]|nr:hypothetical protein IFR05_002644 [Cadophora sp. M221]
MISYAHRGYAPVKYAYIPDDFLPSFLRSRLVCLRLSRTAQNTRATWAQAEMYIAYTLSIGFIPDDIKDLVQNNIDMCLAIHNYEPLFLRHCIRILENMRRAGQLADMPNEVDTTQKASEIREGEDPKASCLESFADATVVEQYGKDEEIEMEMDKCHALDKETEEELREMRRKIHQEAERIYHENAALKYWNDGDLTEPAMTESSIFTQHSDMSNDTSCMVMDDCDRGRSRSRFTSLTRISTPTNYHRTSRGRSNSIRPADSISQIAPNIDRSYGADYSRFRASLAPNTSNKSNSGFSSGFSSTFISEPSYPPSELRESPEYRESRLKHKSGNHREFDLRSMFLQPHMMDKSSRGNGWRSRQVESRSKADSESQASSISQNSSSTTVQTVRRAKDRLDRLRSMSRSRTKNGYNGRERSRSRSLRRDDRKLESREMTPQQEQRSDSRQPRDLTKTFHNESKHRNHHESRETHTRAKEDGHEYRGRDRHEAVRDLTLPDLRRRQRAAAMDAKAVQYLAQLSPKISQAATNPAKRTNPKDAAILMSPVIKTLLTRDLVVVLSSEILVLSLPLTVPALRRRVAELSAILVSDVFSCLGLLYSR